MIREPPSRRGEGTMDPVKQIVQLRCTEGTFRTACTGLIREKR